jgi:cbb3-type cytochrome oxidase subunit 3
VHVTLAIQTIQASRGPGDAGSLVPGIAALVVLLLIVIAGVASIVSPRWRRRAPRAISLAAGGLVAAYLIGRGIAEFWQVDYSSPASYQHAWGGPTLAGVFAVHSGPGLIILIAIVVWLYRRRQHASTG